MSKIDIQQAVKNDKEAITRLFIEAENAPHLYGFYWIVIEKFLPIIQRQPQFQAVKTVHQAQRVNIKNKVEHELLVMYQDFKKNLLEFQDSNVEKQLRAIDFQVGRCQNTRVGWQHVYRKIQDLLRYLWVFCKKYPLVGQYAQVKQVGSSIDFEIGELCLVPSWEKMQEVEYMLNSDNISDVAVALIFLDSFFKCWNDSAGINLYDLDLDPDVKLFIPTIKGDIQKFMLLREQKSCYRSNLTFFNKGKVLSALNCAFQYLFVEKASTVIDISIHDEFKVFYATRGNRIYLLLEVSNIALGVPNLYILHEFKSGDGSQLFNLTVDIFDSAPSRVIDIKELGRKYGWKNLNWSIFFSKIDLQLFGSVLFKKVSEKDCKNFVGVRFNYSDLSADQRIAISEVLPELKRLES